MCLYRLLLNRGDNLKDLHICFLLLTAYVDSLAGMQVGTLFGSNACFEMRESASNLTKRLAQTAQETFVDFEEAVEKDATKTAVLDGTVHPLTSYVINYVKFLYE